MSWLSRFHQFFTKDASQSSARLFIGSILVGVVSGLGAILFFTLLGWLSHQVMQLGANYYAPEPAGEMSAFEPVGGAIRWWVLILAPAVGGLISGILVFSLAPEAEGHGTDAVIEAFHHKQGFIRKRVPFIKTIASIITIGTGGSAGREGPIAQIGAGFGSYLATTLHLTNDERRTLMLSGAAGGIGAIFRSPLGGALFAVEVLYKRDFEAKSLIPALMASIVSYSIFSARFGWGLMFDTQHYVFRHPIELLFYALFGLICAGVGIVYIKVFYGLRDRFFHKIPILPHLRPAIGGLLVGLVGAFAPHILASGYGYLQQAMQGELTIQFMLLAMLLKIFVTSFTISSGGSGGVFAPSLFIGGMLGGAFGQVAAQFFPDLISNPTSFVLVGMGAFFAGAAKVPISSMIMVSEMTGGYQLLAPMMLSSSTAYLFNSRVTLYEKQVNRMADSPSHFGDFTIDVLDAMVVEQAFRPALDIPKIKERVHLSDLQYLFADRMESYFPVVDDDDNIVGILALSVARKVLFEEDMGHLVIAQDLMTPAVTVTPAESLRSALKKFLDTKYAQITVVDYQNEKKILGLLSHEDIIQAYNQEVRRRKLTT